MKYLLLMSLFSLYFTFSYGCSSREMVELSEQTIKKELGRSFLKKVKSDSPANSTQTNTYLVSTVGFDKSNQKHVMYFRYEMNTNNLNCDLLAKTEVSEVRYDGGCDRGEASKLFKQIFESNDDISEVRGFKYHEPQRLVNDSDIIIMAASSLDDYDGLRHAYMSFRDNGDSCEVIDYTGATFN